MIAQPLWHISLVELIGDWVAVAKAAVVFVVKDRERSSEWAIEDGDDTCLYINEGYVFGGGRGIHQLNPLQSNIIIEVLCI